MNSEAIVQIGTIVIALIGAIITYVAIPFIKSKTTVEQQKNIEFWTRFAVNAAEQLYNTSGTGNKKKEYVLKFLKRKGIKLTIEELNILIEALVKEINTIKAQELKTEHLK